MALRRALRCTLMALAMTLPAVAYPISLTQLLRMPLEQLLRLEISTSSAAAPMASGTATTGSVTAGGRRA